MYPATLLIEAEDDTSIAGAQAHIEDEGQHYAPGFGEDGQYTIPPLDLAQIIWDECHRYPEHVVHFAATVAQMIHECAGFQSKYWRERWNPGGIGAINSNPDLAIKFSSPRAGVRAHVAHLLVYSAGVAGAWKADDLRWNNVVAEGWDGKSKQWVQLNGKWAWPGKTYGQTIISMANTLHNAAGTGGSVAQAQIAGFTWQPADSNHFTPGPRRAKISGGAQHYTAGTNSLPWLTTTSPTNVSATFLVKRGATLSDRGWQLVRLEDVAHTTAFANQYTASIEFEHMEGQPITDAEYEVLAQTWVDIDKYIEEHDLGNLDVKGVLGHKVWVGNPSLTCPNGIDVARIEARRKQLTGTTPPQPSGADPVTGKWIHEKFRPTFDEYGGIYIFGRPISGAFNEMHEGTDRLVQYFERVVMRHFPENAGEWQVQFDLLGSEELRENHPNGAPA